MNPQEGRTEKPRPPARWLWRRPQARACRRRPKVVGARRPPRQRLTASRAPLPGSPGPGRSAACAPAGSGRSHRHPVPSTRDSLPLDTGHREAWSSHAVFPRLDPCVTMWDVRPCRGCWRCPAHVACAAGSVPSPPRAAVERAYGPRRRGAGSGGLTRRRSGSPRLSSP